MSTEMITLRTGSGTIKKHVPIRGKIAIGQRVTHNGDGSYTYVVAQGEDGKYYETKPRGSGYRVARDQKNAQILYETRGFASTPRSGWRRTAHGTKVWGL
jgi:hypothetical protein